METVQAINMYMRLLQQRDTRLRALGLAHIPKCHFFSSFFFCKLYSDRKQYNYQVPPPNVLAVSFMPISIDSPGVDIVGRYSFLV